MTLSRRQWLEISAAAALAPALPARATEAALDLPAPIASLKPMTEGVTPITTEEHRGRLVCGQRRLRESGLDALVLATGSSLTYFTGAKWGESERLFAAVLTREGEPAWVTPAFERERALEQVRVGGDVRAWEEDESPYALVATILRD